MLVLPSRLESPRPLLAATDPPGFADTHAIGGVIGTTRQRLGGIRIEVLGQPGRICLGRKGMQCVFRKAELLAERCKGGCACLFVGTRDETGLLPSHIGTHPAHAFHGLTQ